MRNLLLTVIFISSWAMTSQAQNYWTAAESTTALPSEDIPVDHLSYKVDFEGIKAALSASPMEGAKGGITESEVAVSLPMPNGEIIEFFMEEAPVLMPKLSAKYPGIRSYRGWSPKHPELWMRMDYSSRGVNAIIRGGEYTSIIQPIAQGNTIDHAVYYVNALEHTLPGPDDHEHDHDHHALVGQQSEYQSAMRQLGVPADLKKYRMALACTGEFGFRNGGTVQAILELMNTAMNQLNVIYEPEVAISFVLIDDNERIIFTSGNSDPYENPTIGRELLNQNLTVLNDIIGLANYDIGHIFTIPCTDGIAGVAGGPVCSDFKGRGVTCNSGANIAATVPFIKNISNCV